ncbi:MAG: response regulator [Lachnospiraceae bacterium]|nr:response regulator [Lachnospiraceae bacterium]
MNILIVDDEAVALRYMQEILEKVVPSAYMEMAGRADTALAVFWEKEFDVVFLDISMPDLDGLEMAKEFKEIRPQINIIMVTAHPQYALDALRLYVSGYIVKPVLEEDVRDALEHLRNPIKEEISGLYVQCFGNFEVFYDGEPVRFRRTKAKELFAYLIDRRGASATNAELRAVLWRDAVSDERNQRKYFAQLVRDVRMRLEDIGCGDVFRQERNFYAIVPEKIPCDYYSALKRNKTVLANFHGEYMSQYDWAEERIGTLFEEFSGGGRV